MNPGDTLPISATRVERFVLDIRPVKATDTRPKAKPEADTGLKAGHPAPAPRHPWQESSETRKAIEKLSGEHTKLSIHVNPETGRIVVEILDSKTGETIRKLPLQDSEQRIEESQRLKGFFLDATQ